MALWGVSKPVLGFTITETIMAVAIMTTFFGLTLVTLDSAYKTSLVRGTSDVVMSAIATANARARNGLHGTAWGVYFDYSESSRAANEVIVFSGTSYATRDPQYDIHYNLNPNPHFHWAGLSGSGPTNGNDHEAVFAPLTGETTQYGRIDLAGTGHGVNVEISLLGIPSRTYR